MTTNKELGIIALVATLILVGFGIREILHEEKAKYLVAHCNYPQHVYVGGSAYINCIAQSDIRSGLDVKFKTGPKGLTRYGHISSAEPTKYWNGKKLVPCPAHLKCFRALYTGRKPTPKGGYDKLSLLVKGNGRSTSDIGATQVVKDEF